MRYYSIEKFSGLIARVEGEMGLVKPEKLLLAKGFANLCLNVQRDVNYVAQLKDAVDLPASPLFQSEWISAVRKAANEALSCVDDYLKVKIPGIANRGFVTSEVEVKTAKGGISDVVADVAAVASIQKCLATTQTSLMAATGLLHQLLLRQSPI